MGVRAAHSGRARYVHSALCAPAQPESSLAARSGRHRFAAIFVLFKRAEQASQPAITVSQWEANEWRALSLPIRIDEVSQQNGERELCCADGLHESVQVHFESRRLR